MASFSGRKFSVGFGKETSRGTAVAPAYWAKHLEADFQEKIEKELNESGLGVLDKFNDAEVMKHLAMGKVGGKVTDRTFPLILAAAFGQAPTTSDNADSDASVKDHTFAQSQSNTPLALTIAIKDGNRDERYPLAMLSTLDIDIEVGQWAKWVADFISKKPASASNTVAYVAENEFKAAHASVKLAANVAGLGAATAIPLKSLKLTIDRKVRDYPVVGTVEPHDIFSEELEIKGDFTMLFDSMTHRDSYVNNSFQAMQIALVNDAVTIGAAANPSITLTFERVNLSDWGVDLGLSAMVEQTLGLQALYSESAAKSWSAVVTNTVASY
jgi:hypothetical protein